MKRQSQKNWDQRNPSTSYRISRESRGRAREINTLMNPICAEKQASHSQIAEVCFQYAIAHYRDGSLVIETSSRRPQKVNLTWEEVENGIPREIKPVSMKAVPAPFATDGPQYLAYRLQKETRDQIRKIALELSSTNGEVVLPLLEYALAAYRAGKFRFG
jgi:hypothetical protein